MIKYFMFLVLALDLVTQMVLADEKNKAQEKDLMMGLETIHDIKIDKDTIITRNMKLEKKTHEIKKTSGKITENNENREPDWSYSTFPHTVSTHVEQFKRNMSECLKEVQATDKKTVKRLSPKNESPIHGECLIACVLRRNGVINKGKIHKDSLMTLVSKFFSRDTKLLKKLDKNLDRCIEASSQSKEECKMASQLNDCTNALMAGNKHRVIVNY